MKKYLFILLSALIFLIILEFSIYLIYCHHQKRIIKSSNFEFQNNLKYSLKYSFVREFNAKDLFRLPIIKEKDIKNKKGILIFGCSYAYGASLEIEQNFSSKLAERLKKNVYNRSYPGWGPSHMYFQLDEKNKDNSLYLKNTQKIDKIIYVYMEDHVNRLHQLYWGSIFENIYNIEYVLKNENNHKVLKEKRIKFPLLHTFYIVKFLNLQYERFLNSQKFKNKNYEFEMFIFKECHNILNKKFPNAKFILINYDSCDLEQYKTELEKTGWNYYYLPDYIPNILTNEQYHFKNDCHPTEKAWDIIVNTLVDEKILQY